MTEDVYERFYKADTKEKLISLLKTLYEEGKHGKGLQET